MSLDFFRFARSAPAGEREGGEGEEGNNTQRTLYCAHLNLDIGYIIIVLVAFAGAVAGIKSVKVIERKKYGGKYLNKRKYRFALSANNVVKSRAKSLSAYALLVVLFYLLTIYSLLSLPPVIDICNRA